MLGQVIDVDAGAVVRLDQFEAPFIERRERAAIGIEMVENADLHGEPGRKSSRARSLAKRGRAVAQVIMSFATGRQASDIRSIRSTMPLITSTRMVATTMPAKTPTVSESSRACSM